MSYNKGDVVDYIGSDLSLLGLSGVIIDVDSLNNTYAVSFYYLNSIFRVMENEIQPTSTIIFNGTQTTNMSPTTTIWGGYEPIEIPVTDGKVKFENMHKCQWKFYFGLNQKFEYCIECDAKRDIKE